MASIRLDVKHVWRTHSIIFTYLAYFSQLFTNDYRFFTRIYIYFVWPWMLHLGMKKSFHFTLWSKLPLKNSTLTVVTYTSLRQTRKEFLSHLNSISRLFPHSKPSQDINLHIRMFSSTVATKVESDNSDNDRRTYSTAHRQL